MNAHLFDVAFSGDLDWHVNGHAVSNDVQDFLREQTTGEVESWGQRTCPHCAAEFIARSFNDVVDDNDTWHNNRTYVFRHCDHCAHWEFNGAEGGNKCMDPQEGVLLSAVVARFTKELPDCCSNELAQYLRRNPAYWHEMSPKRLEKLVAEVFKANYDDAEVVHVGKPFDRGIDVVFVESSGIRWLIQVKRRERPVPSEGFATLQSILGALALDGERHGIVVSTADSFSFHARRGRQRAGQQGFVVEFVDKGLLNRMITPLLPRIPWNEIFGCPELSRVAKDVQQHFWGPECDGQMGFPFLNDPKQQIHRSF